MTQKSDQYLIEELQRHIPGKSKTKFENYFKYQKSLDLYVKHLNQLDSSRKLMDKYSEELTKLQSDYDEINQVLLETALPKEEIMEKVKSKVFQDVMEELKQ